MAQVHFRKKLLLGSLLGSTVLASPVWAQQGPSGVAAGQIDEILVTAQRRTERLEEVPVFLTVASGEQLQRAGVNNIEDIGKISAGVQVNRGGAFSQPAIRGISTLTLGNGLENNVAVYIDGVYQPDAVAINADLANLANVQILKGPQGTLYGRNATGGAIVIETLKPSDELEGNIQATYGRYDDRRLRGYISAPITDNLGFSIAGYWRESDGYVTDIGADPHSSADNFDAAPLESSSVRAKLRFEPTADLALTLGYNYVDHKDARGLAYRITDYAPSYLPTPPGRPIEDDTVALNLLSDNRMRMNEVTLNIDWATEIGAFTAVTAHSERGAYSNFDFDGSRADITRSIAEDIKQYTLQQSVNLNIDVIDRWNINVGGMYYRDRFRINDTQSWSGFTQQYYYDMQLDSEAWAAYVDATWEFVDRWFLTVGGRYSTEDRGGAYQVYNITGAPVQPADKTDDYSDFTPRVVLRHELGDRTSIYASYTAGFRSGTFYSGTQPDPALYQSVDQEEIDAFEIGFKTAQNNYRLSAAVFYYDYQDLQVGLSVPNPIGTGVIQQIFNAPKAEVYGAEAQIDYMPTPALNLRAGIAYLDGEYKDFPNATGVGLDPSSGLNVTPQPQDWGGHQMARAPEWTANLGLDYTWDVENIGAIVVAGNINYSDSYVVQNLSLYGPLAGPDLENKQRYRQGSFTTVNAQIDWTDPSGRLTAGLFGENLSDERYYLTLSGSALGDYSQLAWPRTFGARVGYNF